MSSPRHTPPLIAGQAPPPEAMTPSQLAHELNNLLDGSLRCVNLVLRQLDQLGLDSATAAALQKRLATADRSMHHMADILVRYANPVAGQTTSPTDIVTGRGTLLDAMTHAVNVYGPAIQQRHIELVTRVDPTLCDLPAGPLYTVLANALNNAMQAVRAEPSPMAVTRGEAMRHRITVRIVREADDVVLEVSDTGPGLSPRLFDTRGRFRFGLTTKSDGHGVGLGVCRQIAADLGGSLSLRNHSSGRGAVLRLMFPRPDASRSMHEARRAG